MTRDEVQDLVREVDGWLADEEGCLLYELARSCTGRGAIVEIGSWKGKSTIWLAHGSKAGRGVKLYAVDPHTGSPEHRALCGAVWTFEEFSANIQAAGVADLVAPIVKTAAAAAQEFAGPVELLFIDGAHEYDAVKADFHLWFPRLIDGGTIVFHDTTRGSGPRRVVEERVYRSTRFRAIRVVDSITVAEKVARASLQERIANRYLLALRGLRERVAAAALPGPARLLIPRALRSFARARLMVAVQRIRARIG